MSSGSMAIRRPSRRGVMNAAAANPAFVSQPYTVAFTNAYSTRRASNSKLKPKSSGNENSSVMMRMPMASAPSAVATASQSAAATKKPVAELSGPSGIRLRRRFGGWSYGRSFFRVHRHRARRPSWGSLSGRSRPPHCTQPLLTSSTKAARWEAAFDLDCVVAGDGFEPPTFGL